MSSPSEPDRTPSEAAPAVATPALERTGPYIADTTRPVESVAASAGRCRLLGEIARGGMGAVFKAYDPDLGRDLAVKVLLEQHRGRPELVRRFLDEARVGGRLQHPGVAPVHDVGRLADERPFFAMKLVEGRTLEELLRQRKSPADDLPRFLKVFEQVSQTLAYAHAQGVIHRDLKPLNIMVGAFGEVQVMDWGLSKVIARKDEGGRMKDESETPAGSDSSFIPPPSSFQETGTGQVLGTPSYMAPEQARGEADRLDARCDVFGLGAILCTILTGRPPYVGGDAREVVARAGRGELADACARLDACDADAELVGLAKGWLSAEPADRPADAGLVAEAMTAYLAGVQERLRRAELAKAAAQTRALEARKRLHLTAILAATILLAVAGAGAGALWYQRDQSVRAAERARRAADTERDVTAALDEAATRGKDAAALRNDPARWEAALTEAVSAVGRAEGVLNNGDGGEGLRPRAAALREQLEASDKDRRMIARLEEARLRGVAAGADGFDYAGAAALYAAAFGQDLHLNTQDPQQTAEHINRRAIREDLLAGLEDWARVSPDADEAGRLLRIVEAVDSDPGSFRHRCRALLAAKDWDGLRRLALGPEAEGLPTVALVTAAKRMEAAAGPAEAAKFLKDLDQRRPGDFSVALETALACWQMKPEATDEAIRYDTAAVALRPQSSVAHNNLGAVLHDKGLFDEAAAECRKAVALSDASPEAHSNLGAVLCEMGEVDEAIAECRKAIERKPGGSAAHKNLGAAYLCEKRFDEAAAESRDAVRLAPGPGRPLQPGSGPLRPGPAGRGHRRVPHGPRPRPRPPRRPRQPRQSAARQGPSGRGDHRVPQSRPAGAEAPGDHFSLGTALLAKGLTDEAIAEFRTAIDLDPNAYQAHGNLAAALRAKGRLDEAIAEYRKTVDLKPDFAESHYDLAIVLRETGRLDEAAAEYRKTLDLKPELAEAWCNLGSVLRAQGRFAESLAAIRRGHELGSKIPGWPYPSADWVRQAEDRARLDAMAAPLLRGEAEPASSAAALRFADLSMEKRCYGDAARFYADALVQSPAPGQELPAVVRYNAACAAALTGCGQGEDAKRLDDKERARWRKQALDWLMADLALWTKKVADGKAEERAAATQRLQQWKQDRDLAGVRDADALAKLPPDERAAWRQLWADVDALLAKVQPK